MDIQVWQAIIIALWSSLLISSAIFVPLYGFYGSMMSGLIIGGVLGDPTTGLIAGAMFQIAYLGFGRAGGVNPPSSVAPSLFGMIWVIRGGMSIEVALAVTFPIAIFISFMNTALMTVTTPLSKLVPYAIEKKNKFLYNVGVNGTLILFLITGLVIGFLAVYTSESINNGLSQVPLWLMNSFKVAGNLLPGVGFSVILSIMLKKVYLPFILLGYVGLAYFGLSSIGLLLLSVIFGLIIVGTQKTTEILITRKMNEFIETNNNQLVGGVSNGI